MRAKLAFQVCGSEKSFAVAKVQKTTAKVPQTCGFAVAKHPLLFCEICDCGVKCKFAVPSTAFNTRNLLGRDVTENFQVKKNKAKMKIIHHRFFYLLF